MMRILLTTAPMAAHVRPALPLARALVENGHRVDWYTGADFEAAVTNCGAAFRPARAAPVHEKALRGTAGAGGFAGLNRLVIELFLKPIPAFMADLEPVFDEVEPDVVVSDHSFRPGLFVAERRGIPRVAFSAGPLNLSSIDTAPFGLGWPPATTVLGRLRNRIAHWFVHGVRYRERQRVLSGLRADLGLPSLPGYSVDWVAMTCHRYLQTGVPEFEYPRRDLPDSVEFIGATQPVATSGTEAPEWWPDVLAARRDGRPVVFVTQGTIATDLSNLVEPAISALADDNLLVVATTSGQDPAAVLAATGYPANVRVSRFIPYELMLPVADVIVTNGGYGGVQTALTYGVPLVVSGTSEDRMETNARVAWSGTGISLRTDRPRPKQLGCAVRSLLADPSYRRRAEGMSEAFAAWPGLERAVAAIAAVAGAGPAAEPPGSSEFTG